MFTTSFKRTVGLLASCPVGFVLLGADVELPSAKPVPRAQAIPLPHHQISLQRDGIELTRLHFDPAYLRPFVFPVLGPAGQSLTRMGHPHDPVTHSHHNSVWISHHDVNGLSFWDDRGQGRIVHLRVEQLEDGAEEAGALTVNEWRNAEGAVLLTERRRTAIRLLPEGEWWLLLDLELSAAGSNSVTLGKTPFGLIGVRVAKTMGVHDGGGMNRNSAGGVNEPGTHWKPARWLDYSGPVATGVNEGLTLMDHPANPNHPTVFHVRDDGWMGASLTFDGPREIKTGPPLRLRYGLWVHRGVPSVESIESQWRSFADSKLSSLETKRR
ncbi:MAG: PmoA family protein [Verrucomicrobia bacterium]|nr:PmoA family protein [Verrucomicrobiota bacterium]